MLTQHAAALDPLRFVRPLVSLQRLARHVAAAAPDSAGAAGHSVHLPLTRLDKLFRARWRGRQPESRQLPAACEPDPQSHPDRQPQHGNDSVQPALVDVGDDAECSASMVRTLRVLDHRALAALSALAAACLLHVT